MDGRARTDSSDDGVYFPLTSLGRRRGVCSRAAIGRRGLGGCLRFRALRGCAALYIPVFPSPCLGERRGPRACRSLSNSRCRALNGVLVGGLALRLRRSGGTQSLPRRAAAFISARNAFTSLLRRYPTGLAPSPRASIANNEASMEARSAVTTGCSLVMMAPTWASPATRDATSSAPLFPTVVAALA